MRSESLTELANRHASDKGTLGPSPSWPVHNYSDVYEAYLHGLREEVLSILEIGLGVTGDHWHSAIVHGRNTGGASLKMWFDYFPKAQIFGIDVNECPELENDRIRTFVAHQGRAEDLKNFVQQAGNTQFDLIFDDGSHRPDDQQVSLSYLFRSLKPGGLYFIEDLMANGIGDTGSGRSFCNDVVNTRALLKHFVANGAFLKPHALLDSNYLADNIQNICFHVPKIVLSISYQAKLRQPCKPSMSYVSNSETLCAIRKKVNASS